MPSLFTEDTYEQAIIELFENMGYDHLYAPDFDRDYTSPLLDSILRDSLVRINRGLPVEAIDEALAKLKNFDTGSLLQKNIIFMDYLQNGITVKFFIKGEEQSSIVRLIDYENVKNNSFYVVNQFTFLENGNNRRPDIILFINGLPLVLMELKSPAKDEVGAENAYHQIRNYMQDIPSIFYYNAICVISDLSMNKAGTITSGLDRFMEWKTKDGNYEDTAYASFETFYEGMFQKERLLDILKNFILFSGVSNSRFKVLAGYHQYFAVHKAIEKAKVATKTDGKGGVFWHTQGSGKSLSMVFYAHLLQDALDSPTIVVMTDRIDLDDQLYAQFSQCADFLRQTPVQAESKEHLKSLLDEKHIQERANELAKKAEAIWPYPTLTAEELAPYQAEEKTVQKYSLETYDVNAFTRMLFESLDKRIMNLSPAVKKEYKKLYVAYKLDTNFVDIVFQKQRLRISINMKFSEINDPNDICKDITGLGRWGNGDVELFMEHQDELDQIMEIVKQSYDTQAE